MQAPKNEEPTRLPSVNKQPNPMEPRGETPKKTLKFKMNDMEFNGPQGSRKSTNDAFKPRKSSRAQSRASSGGKTPRQSKIVLFKK